MPDYSDRPPLGFFSKFFEIVAYVADGARGVQVLNLEDLEDVQVHRINTNDAHQVFVKSHMVFGDDTTATGEREFLFVADETASVVEKTQGPVPVEQDQP